MSSKIMPRVPRQAAVLGGGAFGTALANMLARNGASVKLQIREKAARDGVNFQHENVLFLKGAKLSPNVRAVETVAEAVKDAELILFVIPTEFLRSFLVQNHQSFPRGDVPLVVCSKGIENATLMTPFEIMEEELPGKFHHRIAALSGPTFAREIVAGLPANITVASRHQPTALAVQSMISSKSLRAYTSDDVIGVELCGAVKNVLAIAAGASEGLKLGLSARAGLITRGLAELSRLSSAKGANPLTVVGLAGVGDLVLTCTGSLSRNWQVGYRMARGETLKQILGSSMAVAEGVSTSRSVTRLARQLNVDMPICHQVYQVLFEGKSIKEAMESLQSRDLKAEIDESVQNSPYFQNLQQRMAKL